MMDVRWNKHVVILYDKKKDKELTSALKTYIEKEFAPCDVVEVSNESFTPVINAKARDIFYRFCLKYARWFLRWKSTKEETHQKKRIREEKKQDKLKDASLIAKGNPLVSRIVNIINRFEPLIIICTTPESLKLSIDARKIVNKDIKIFAEISDFAVDAAFVRFEADGYFVENGESRKILEKYGIEQNKIYVTGMPIISNNTIYDKDEIKKKYGFTDNLPIVVINGGDYETDTIRENILRLMEVREKFNMLIITGNDKVRRRYMNASEFSAGVGFSEVYEEDMMAIADILITVPDSTIIFNAFKLGVAVIIAPFITVKERDIRKYLVKRALVLPVKNTKEMVAAVDELLVEPERRKEFISRGINYSSLSISESANQKPALAESFEDKKSNNLELKENYE